MAHEPHSEHQRGGSGNFANDPAKASEAGKKSGEHSHVGQSHPDQGKDESSQSAGRGENFAKDREKASEAGRKGGEHSHGAR